MKFLLSFTLLFVLIRINAQNQLLIPDTLIGNTMNLEIKHDHMHFFPGIETETMGINGPVLGPTLILTKGQQVNMNVTNILFDTTTIHWHGLHVSSENDGGPHTPILPFSTWNPSFTVLDKAGTYWYHPHLHHMTNMHVQMGVAGMIIVRDNEEAALNLPRTYGIDDIPIIIQTKAFDSNNQIITESALDTTVLVNATLDPIIQLPAQIVRLRLLNGSSERVYNVGLSNNQNFHLIGTDAGLIGQPLALTRLKLAPGERAEILINLQGLNGQQISLKSFASELPNGIYGALQPGMGAGQSIPNYTLNPLNGANFNLLKIQVIPPILNGITELPNTLVTQTPWNSGLVDAMRTLTFSPQNMGPTAITGPFMINNSMFDMNVVNYEIPLNNLEIWTLQNNTPIAHPFHIHNVPFYILDINGQQPPPELSGRKDVVLVPGGQGTVRFITKFEDFSNPDVPYMYHCHMLTHEDQGMMGQFIIFDPNANVDENNNESTFEFYPNPFSDNLFINSKTESIITIFNTLGTEVFKTTVGITNFKCDLSSLNQGAYFIRFNNKEFDRSFVLIKK